MRRLPDSRKSLATPFLNGSSFCKRIATLLRIATAAISFWPTLALRKLVAGQTEVTREEIDKTLESEIGPKVRVRMIAVKSREQAEQLRKEALKQAQADPDSFGSAGKGTFAG